MPSIKRLVNKSRSAKDLSALTALMAKVKGVVPEGQDPEVLAAFARRANQLGSHDLAASLVEKFTNAHPKALREAIIAALALGDPEMFDECEFNLETLCRRSAAFSASGSGGSDASGLALKLCSDVRRKTVSKAGAVPDRWLPKAARSGGAQGAVAGTLKAVAGGPSSAQVEVAKSKAKRRTRR